jgi:hypothetical protein
LVSNQTALSKGTTPESQIERAKGINDEMNKYRGKEYFCKAKG